MNYTHRSLSSSYCELTKTVLLPRDIIVIKPTTSRGRKKTFEQKSMWLKWKPVTVARHFNHCINTIFSKKVIFTGLYPVGQILNVDRKSESKVKVVDAHD